LLDRIMIIDLARFVEKERPHWQDLEKALDGIADNVLDLSDLKQSRRVLALFQRACSDLGRIGGANAEPELRSYLEALVARGYAEIHSVRADVHRFRPLHWLLRVFPVTVRRQAWALWLSIALTLVGCLVGGLLVLIQPDAMESLSPFAHTVQMTPSQRVAMEEDTDARHWEDLEGSKSAFSAHLMANNIGVSINAMALGLTYGLGTVILLFYNGVILGSVAVDYIMDGQLVFLLGWLLPHGTIEIPAILLAGQAGFVIARAMIGWGTREGLRARMRLVVPDLATLIGGVAVMLVWAGFIEAFMSQYHAPVLPYWIKIAFGTTELVVLVAFLFLGGRERDDEA
jgi:uncharacterized membrane protein SpoIIM required for sporulation